MRRRRGARPAVGERRGGLRTETGEENCQNLLQILHMLHVLTQPARTGAVLQDAVGLRFDGGHHGIEIAQVQRRKQHSEREGNKPPLLWTTQPFLSGVTADRLDLRRLFRKSLNPLLAASASPLGSTQGGRAKVSRYYQIKRN